MSTFELWEKGCTANGNLIWLMEGRDDTALYMTLKEYEYQHNYYRTTPVYHVWIKGKWKVATTNYQEAYHIWEARK